MSKSKRSTSTVTETPRVLADEASTEKALGASEHTQKHVLRLVMRHHMPGMPNPSSLDELADLAINPLLMLAEDAQITLDEVAAAIGTIRMGVFVANRMAHLPAFTARCDVQEATVRTLPQRYADEVAESLVRGESAKNGYSAFSNEIADGVWLACHRFLPGVCMDMLIDMSMGSVSGGIERLERDEVERQREIAERVRLNAPMRAAVLVASKQLDEQAAREAARRAR